MSIKEQNRLFEYYPFSNETLDAIDSVADRHRGFSTFEDQYIYAAGKLGEKIIHDSDGYGKHVEILDINPDAEQGTLLYHLTLGEHLGSDRVLSRLFVLADTLPDTRILASSNPGNIRYNSGAGALTIENRVAVRNGLFMPWASSLVTYAFDKKATENVTQVGYGSGADVAVEAGKFADAYGVMSNHVIAIEPVGTESRPSNLIRQLLRQSAFCDKEQLRAANCDAYSDAVFADQRRLGRSALGVFAAMRSTNRAMLRGLGQGVFEYNLDGLLNHDENMCITVIWGKESVLARDSIMAEIAERHTQEKCFRAMPVEAQRHNMDGDIFLHAALIKEALDNIK